MEVDSHRDLRMVLSRNECPLPLETQFSQKFDSFFDDDINNDLKDDPNVQALQEVRERSDIPPVNTVDDSKFLTSFICIYGNLRYFNSFSFLSTSLISSRFTGTIFTSLYCIKCFCNSDVPIFSSWNHQHFERTH